MDTASYWQGYSIGLPLFNENSRTRTIDIGEHKLSLPIKASAQHPIERFNTGESPLPHGLVPNPVHTYQGLNPATMSGITFNPIDHDTTSWGSSMPEDDRHSLSADSSCSSGQGAQTAWAQRSPISEYQSNPMPMVFQETSPSSPDTPYPFRPSEVIDPSLTLNYQEPDMYGHKEPLIKFEFTCLDLQIDEAEYEQEPCSPQSSITNLYHHYEHDHNTAFHHPQTPFATNWGARKVPVTRSQSQNESRHQSQENSKHSGNGSSKESKSPKSPLSPTSRKKIFRRRGSSSGDESPTRQNTRPKTYKKKVPFYTCNEDDCRGSQFKNKSELKKHIETQHTKPYICIFGFTKCQQRFGARNEWKRHIATQHLVLYKYICDHPRCRDKPKAKTLFNRGDLFMKHQERMHSPADIHDRKHDDPELISWKSEMRDAKARCETLRPTPQKMTCGFCDLVLEKEDSTWKEMIDHVGLHYQANDEAVKKGWKDDMDLIAWMREHGLYNDEDTMDVDSETPDSRKSRRHSYGSSSESSSARQIKQEHMVS